MKYWIEAFTNCITINEIEIQFRYHPEGRLGKADRVPFNMANNRDSTIEEIKTASYPFTVNNFRKFVSRLELFTSMEKMTIVDLRKFSVLYLCNQCNYYSFFNLGSERTAKLLFSQLKCFRCVAGYYVLSKWVRGASNYEAYIKEGMEDFRQRNYIESELNKTSFTIQRTCGHELEVVSLESLYRRRAVYQQGLLADDYLSVCIFCNANCDNKKQLMNIIYKKSTKIRKKNGDWGEHLVESLITECMSPLAKAGIHINVSYAFEGGMADLIIGMYLTESIVGSSIRNHDLNYLRLQVKVCSFFTVKFIQKYDDYVVVCIIVNENNDGNQENKIRFMYVAFMKDLIVKEGVTKDNTPKYVIDLKDERNAKHIINVNDFIPHLISMYLYMNGKNQLLKYWEAVSPRKTNINQMIEFNTQRQITIGANSRYYNYQFVPHYTVIDNKLSVRYKNSNDEIVDVSLTEQAKSGLKLYKKVEQKNTSYKLTDNIDFFTVSNIDEGYSYSIPSQLLINPKKTTQYLTQIDSKRISTQFQIYKYTTKYGIPREIIYDILLLQQPNIDLSDSEKICEYCHPSTKSTSVADIKKYMQT